MTANRPYAAWLRRLAGLVALAGVFVLSACGGGSGAPNNPFAPPPLSSAPLTVLPAAPTIYSQVAATLTISGGVAAVPRVFQQCGGVARHAVAARQHDHAARRDRQQRHARDGDDPGFRRDVGPA